MKRIEDLQREKGRAEAVYRINLIIRQKATSPRGNIPLILEALRVEWRNSKPQFVSLPERGNENISFPLMEIEPTTYGLVVRALERFPRDAD